MQKAGERESIRRHSHTSLTLPAGGCSWGLRDIKLGYYKRTATLFLYKSILCISLETQYCFLKEYNNSQTILQITIQLLYIQHLYVAKQFVLKDFYFTVFSILKYEGDVAS